MVLLHFQTQHVGFCLLQSLHLFFCWKASVEVLNVNLESQGQRIACGSLPLGPVATPITEGSNNDTDPDPPDTTDTTVTAEVDGSSATG